MRPPPGSTTGPPRERIAESLAEQVLGMLQRAAVGAERVEDRSELAAGAVDRDHVALVGGDVADVAAGGGEQVGAGDVERRAELLVDAVRA